MPPLTRARAASEAPPTLLDALARAPAAAALVVAALGQKDRKALRLACTQLRDAVGEATTKLTTLEILGRPSTRPPTARSWPQLEELTMRNPNLPALEALGAETWSRLRSLCFGRMYILSFFEACRARAFAAALRRMPALRALELRFVTLSDDAAAALFRASSAEAAPQLRALTIVSADLTPAAVRMLAASGWRLEELDLGSNHKLRTADAAALVSAPTFALRRLIMPHCGLDAAALFTLANAPWPLEELDRSFNDFSAAAAGPALAALSRRAGLRRLNVNYCKLSAATFKALVEAAWPALTYLTTQAAKTAFFDGPHALGAAAFAGFPALEELVLAGVQLREADAALLASRRWPRLKKLNLCNTRLGDAGLAALARGPWPALERLDVRQNGLGEAGLAALARGAWPALEELDLRHHKLSAPPSLEDARRWAPALEELHQ